jgi:FMN phosphatase YigB (HAD superfamily)
VAFRAFCFDLFDTLVDLTGIAGGLRVSTERMHAAVCEHAPVSSDRFLTAYRAVERELRKSRYAEGLEVSSDERFGELLGRLGIVSPQLPARLTAIHMGVIRSCVHVPGHHEGLLREWKRSVQLGICSNFTHAATARAILDEASFSDSLGAVVISDDIGLRKPRREMFEAVLAELDVAPEEMLHVGDNLRADVAGAAALGVASAWITRCVPEPEAALARHEGPMPDYVVGDLCELGDLLGGPSRVRSQA